MRFALALAFNDERQLPTLARVAEESGFSSVILSDHLFYPEPLETDYPYTDDGLPPWLPDTPWPDPFVTAAALGAVTTRLRFIVSVFVMPLRHPMLAAKTVMTTSVLTGGRLELGVGAGWMREEFESVDVRFSERGRRLNESIELLRKCEAGGLVEHHGEFFNVPPFRMSPVPSSPTPIYGGGLSKPALRRATHLCDGWAGQIQSRKELPGLIKELARLRAESPRQNDHFPIISAVGDAFDEQGYREMEEIGVTDLITVPWMFYGISTKEGGLEEKCDAMRRFGDEVLHRFGYAATDDNVR